MEEQESTTPLAVEINFLSELLRSNRQQHRAAKHFRLSCALVARVGRLAPPPADNERAAAACDAAAAVALAAARGVREDLARGFFAALNACWLACLKRARARGDTRRGGFLDSCLEPCYPPPGDECRSLRLRYGIRAGTSWGLAADSAAVQARWAALSCDELVGDGVANKWRA